MPKTRSVYAKSRGKTKFFNKRNVLIFLVLFVLAFTVYLVFRSKASVDANFANMAIGKITPGSGQVGVGMWWHRVGQPDYSPCDITKDLPGPNQKTNEYGGCVMSKFGPESYYQVLHYSDKPDTKDANGTVLPYPSDFTHGIFINNRDPNHCKNTDPRGNPNPPWPCTDRTSDFITHNWGKYVDTIVAEIYPFGANGKYDIYGKDSNGNPNLNAGGVRITVEGLDTVANGGRYSVNVGDVRLPQIGDPKVGSLNGFVKDNGQPVRAGRVNFDAFDQTGNYTSSTGYKVYGFASFPNNQDSYYNLGALPKGKYTLFITDNDTHNKVVFHDVEIRQPGERLDFDLSKYCFHTNLTNCDNAQNKNRAPASYKPTQ